MSTYVQKVPQDTQALSLGVVQAGGYSNVVCISHELMHDLDECLFNQRDIQHNDLLVVQKGTTCMAEAMVQSGKDAAETLRYQAWGQIVGGAVQGAALVAGMIVSNKKDYTKNVEEAQENVTRAQELDEACEATLADKSRNVQGSSSQYTSEQQKLLNSNDASLMKDPQTGIYETVNKKIVVKQAYKDALKGMKDADIRQIKDKLDLKGKRQAHSAAEQVKANLQMQFNQAAQAIGPAAQSGLGFAQASSTQDKGYQDALAEYWRAFMNTGNNSTNNSEQNRNKTAQLKSDIWVAMERLAHQSA